MPIAWHETTRKKLFNINRTAKTITEKLPISDRIDKMLDTDAYIATKITKKIPQTKFHVA